MMSQSGQQTIAIHTLTNISRSKGNQAMKFGQLIEHNTRNIFNEKLLSISLDQQSKAFYSLLLLYVKFRAIKTH